MKRFTFGIVVALSTVILPFSSFASATSSVDYEKSVGQVDGADTVNWVIEATSDGGYVVGGQTMRCYKITANSDAEPNSSGGGLGSMMLFDEDAQEGELVDFQKCIDYMQREGMMNKDNLVGDAASRILEKSALAYVCLQDVFAPAALPQGITGNLHDDNTYYVATCVDYIAKFRVNGTREWLTTIEDRDRPTAVRQIGNKYLLSTERGDIYEFTSNGAKNGDGKRVDISNDQVITKSYFNSDGSMIALAVNNNGTGIPSIVTFNQDGTVKATINSGQSDWYYALIPIGNDEYVTNHERFDEEGYGRGMVEIISGKNLTITPHPVNDKYEHGVNLISANNRGDVMIVPIIYVEDDSSEPTATPMYSYDRTGKKLGEVMLPPVEKLIEESIGAKDFTYMYYTWNLENESEMPVVHITKYNSNMSVRFKYDGTGYEYIADVAELRDESLAGAGVAVGQKSNMPVTGAANGGYLRLVAKQQTNPTPTPSERPVDNPKTWDAVDTVATIGGVALLGLGFFIRRNLNRR